MMVVNACQKTVRRDVETQDDVTGTSFRRIPERLHGINTYNMRHHGGVAYIYAALKLTEARAQQ